MERLRTLTSIGAMRRRRGSITIAAGAALLIAGCGSADNPVPGSQSDTLVAQLDTVEQAVEKGRCEIAAGQAQGFEDQVSGLSDVDADVKDKLEQAASRLVELAQDQCVPVESGATGATGTETTSTATSATEPETTTETTTQPEPADEGSQGSEQTGGGGSSGVGGNLDVGEGAGGSSGSVSPGTGGISGGGSP
jgi:hypothetical protein